MVFEQEEDARRVMDVLPKRFEKYGLTLHPEKTRLVPFRAAGPMRPRRDDDEEAAADRTFDFLGFTTTGACPSLATGWCEKRTAKDRFRATLRRIAEWCRAHRHRRSTCSSGP